MTDHTPSAHAKLSPSGAKGWFKCAGRLVLEAAFPNLPNEHSDRGTAQHEVAAWCLTQDGAASSRVGEQIKVSHETEPDRHVEFTPDMATATQGYVNYVRRKAQGHALYVETRVPFSKFVAEADQFGTTDATILNLEQGELDVTDAKFGHTPVSPERNPQLMTYAVAMLGELYERAQAQAAEPADEPELEIDDDLS